MTRDPAMMPGATLGVLGGGQLGRMFVVAAMRTGYHTVVYAPEKDCPAAQVASEHIHTSYDDQAALLDFAGRCDVVTLEFENVPAHSLETIGGHTKTRPGPKALAIAQDRLAERAFLDRHGLPVSSYSPVCRFEQLKDAAEALGYPGVLKAARLGYDGKGQMKIQAGADLHEAWTHIGAAPALYESWVDYQLELSVLVARSPSGQTETFGPIENHHANHILDLSVVPARIDAEVARQAAWIARRVAEALSLQGLICVEMFLTRDHRLLINELAPRPHNSGHLTIEACGVSQFEQQVRAICDLPLGKMAPRRAAAMVNLLGDAWIGGRPDWHPVLEAPDTWLHLYGKAEPKTGRKMGHLTVTADTPEQAAEKARLLAARATSSSGEDGRPAWQPVGANRTNTRRQVDADRHP